MSPDKKLIFLKSQSPGSLYKRYMKSFYHLWHMEIGLNALIFQKNAYQKKTDSFPSLQTPTTAPNNATFLQVLEHHFSHFQSEVGTLTAAAVIPGKILRSPTFLFILVWTRNFFLVLALQTVSQFTVKRSSLLNLILRHAIKYTCSTCFLQFCF